MKCSGLCYVQGVRPLSRSARQQISIETIAGYLLQKQGSMYIFPGERTGSIKLYSSSNTFYDFGRGVGGDVIKRKLHRQNGKQGTGTAATYICSYPAAYRLYKNGRSRNRPQNITVYHGAWRYQYHHGYLQSCGFCKSTERNEKAGEHHIKSEPFPLLGVAFL